jgi:hypothetical protein
MEPIGRPETSVLNQLAPRNNPEDGRKLFVQHISVTKFTHKVSVAFGKNHRRDSAVVTHVDSATGTSDKLEAASGRV